MSEELSSKKRRKKGWAWYLRLVFAGVFIAVLVGFVRQADLGAQVSQFDIRFAGLSLLLSVVMVSISTLKWKVLLGQQGHAVSFGYLMRVYFIGYYFSNFLPSNFGGDVVRSMYTGRRIGSQQRAAVAVFLERFTGLVLLLVLVVVMPWLVSGMISSPYFWVPAVGAGGLLMVIGWLLFHRDPLALADEIVRGLLAVLGRLRLPGVKVLERMYGKVHDALENFRVKMTSSFKEIGRERKLLVPVWLISVAFYFMTLVNVYLGFRTFGYTPDFLLVAAIVPTALFVAMMPVSVFGGLGYTELWWVVYFSVLPFAGMPEAAVLLMALVLRFKMILLGVIGMPLHMTHPEELPQLDEETA